MQFPISQFHPQREYVRGRYPIHDTTEYNILLLVLVLVLVPKEDFPTPVFWGPRIKIATHSPRLRQPCRTPRKSVVKRMQPHAYPIHSIAIGIPQESCG